ncbi:Membrane protein insertase YidC [Poriferisphaera corsica]|uniref:Membrane protein insertase YidC n=1 Tax=Poriferisphaera corsica TaxID=2528020 RepID=A0A517YVC1_9BACT|nr:YidC/Oxa1 family insertase periplasmic-domain containing protein [Poriferisphaera corsica]QDU34170.1 Membrane protein insertase YidC [Poriferisphaera corsica]
MRILVPIIAVLLGLLFAAAFLFQGAEDEALVQEQTTAIEQREQAEAKAVEQIKREVDEVKAEPQVETPIVTEVAPIEGLKVRQAAISESQTLGSDDTKSGYKLKVELYRWGSGVKRFTLADYDRVTGPTGVPYSVEGELKTKTGRDQELNVFPYTANSIRVNGQVIELFNKAWESSEVKMITDGEQVTYSLVIEDGDGNDVVEVVRTYVLPKDSYSIELKQQVVNLSGKPIDVQYDQYAQGDVIDDGAAYLGDKRQFLTAYFPKSDPLRTRIVTYDGIQDRRALLEDFKSAAQNGDSSPAGIWPNIDNIEYGSVLAWFAAENRYFSVVTSADVSKDVTKPSDVTPIQEVFPEIKTHVVPSFKQDMQTEHPGRIVIFGMESQKTQLQPGEVDDLSISIFAGPRLSSLFNQAPYEAMAFDDMVRYVLGCTWCTFQPLARALLWFLTVIHAIVMDWGIAIIILVLIVRLVLHPITRRSQINMMKMGKQMQAIQPEMEKLKKKYADDSSKLQPEMMKLYKEKHINPFNMLGCLPMFLQMPIWVALYAMLYYAIELRGQPAFYNVFNSISQMFGGDWQFLTSLSSPDRFISLFADQKPIQLIFITLDYSSINILPLLMGVVFFVQQKFTTPPATTDQARQQQKMMKFMVLLFPLFLYSAPSGLTLYILASTSAGIVDSYFVRKHVRELEERGELFTPRKTKPKKSGGFMDRMQKVLEEKQKKMQQPDQGNRKPPKRK